MIIDFAIEKTIILGVSKLSEFFCFFLSEKSKPAAQPH